MFSQVLIECGRRLHHRQGYVKFFHENSSPRALKNNEPKIRLLLYTPNAADASHVLELCRSQSLVDKMVSDFTRRFSRAELFAELGRYDDALAEIQRAIALDPLNNLLHNMHGFILLYSGDAAAAERIFRSILERDPQFTISVFNYVIALWQLEQYERVLALNEPLATVVTRALIDPSARPAALRALANQRNRERYWPGGLAIAYLKLGLPDSAAVILNRAADSWRPSLAYMARMPAMRSIATHPQFLEYRRKVRLE